MKYRSCLLYPEVMFGGNVLKSLFGLNDGQRALDKWHPLLPLGYTDLFWILETNMGTFHQSHLICEEFTMDLGADGLPVVFKDSWPSGYIHFHNLIIFFFFFSEEEEEKLSKINAPKLNR